MRESSKSRCGFTLIEVSLAILMVAVGLLALFGLFPLGLRESEMGIVDTHEAMFADHILSGLEANALAITNWNDWTNSVDFSSRIAEEIYPIQTGVWSFTNVGEGVDFPELDPMAPDEVVRYVRYRLTISDHGARKTAELEVKSGIYGDFDQNARVYHTELIYLGM